MVEMSKRGNVVDQFTVKIKTRPDASAPKGRIQNATYKLYDTGKAYAGRFALKPIEDWEKFKLEKFERSKELDSIETDMDGRLV
jgi:hypothetical protein